MTDPAELTPAELMMHRFHQDHAGGMIISGAARFEGSFRRGAMEAALEQLQQRHPALRTRIEEHGRAARFVDRASPATIPLEWIESDDPEAWSDQCLEAAGRPFAADEPLFRFRVVSYPAQGCCDVLMVSHHAVTDGISRVMLYQELARLCAGEFLPPVERSTVRPVPAIPTRQGFLWPILKAIGDGVRQHRALRQFPLTTIQAPQRTREALRRLVWNEEGTARLRARARQEGTTIFGALAAALVKTLCDHHQLQGSTCLRAPLSIRDLCQPPVPAEAIGCYVATVEFVLYQADRMPFWELARQGRAKLQAFIDSGLWAVGWKLLGLMLKRGTTIKLQPSFATINNQGPIEDIETPDARLTELSWTVNQRHLAMNLLLAAATVRQKLNLTLRSPWHTPDEVDTLLGSIIEHLDAASA